MSEQAAVPLFSVTGLRAEFDGRTVVSVDALRLPEGRVSVFVGENGSGKTTLLRILNGLLSPAAGSVSYRGMPLASEGMRSEGMRVLRSETVMLHQSPLLFRGSVYQNVSYGLRIRGVPREETLTRCSHALDRVGLKGLERRRASGLSGGEKQRVALARALVLAPKVLLLDEPTANVDPDSRLLVESIVREAALQGTTTIMSTHSMELAYRLCDSLVRMEGGRVVPSTENILKGRVESTDEQFTFFRTGDAVLRCPSRDGEFRVAVLPLDELILSRAPLASSARNQMRGRVTRIEPEDRLLRVTLQCGVELRALITTAAAAEIGVETGRDCVVTFKASAVRLY
jgi:tungstate transport system ATP-binding protein